MRFLFILFALALLQSFQAPRAFAQDPVRLGPSEVDRKIGSAWRGIIFLCDPYCKFVALREKNEWRPLLSGEVVEFSKIKMVSEKDPLYPYLIEKLPIFPYVTPEAKSGDGAGDDDDTSVPPAYAVLPFDLTWAFDAGFSGRLQSVTSNTVLQSDLAPQGIALNGIARLMVSHGKPHRVFGQWIRHQVSASMGSATTFQTKDGENVTLSETTGLYQIWRAWPMFRTGPRFVYLSQSYALKNESPSHFGTNSTAYILGWSVFWNRYVVSLDTLIKGDIKEDQQLRASPLDQSWYRLEVERCSSNVSAFDIRFGLCGAFSYTLDHQMAALAPHILGGGNSEITISTFFFKATIRFGEDFFQ